MYLDWVASGIGIFGCYILGSGRRFGWLLYATASAINIYNGYHAGMLGLSAGCLGYFMLEIKGWITHHRSKENDN